MGRNTPTFGNFGGTKSATQLLDQLASVLDPALLTAQHNLTISGSSTANALVATSPAGAEIAAYAAPHAFALLPLEDNDDAVTITVDGLPSRAIADVDGAALQPGDLKAGRLTILQDDGSQYRITNAPSSSSGGFIANYQEFASSGSWVKPDIAGRWVVGRLIGGGASGGRDDDNSDAACGGGGGGGLLFIVPFADVASSEAITIGAGGAATANNNNGVDGGDTSFGLWSTAEGGKASLDRSEAGGSDIAIGGLGGGVSVSSTARVLWAELGGDGGLGFDDAHLLNTNAGTSLGFVKAWFQLQASNTSIGGADSGTAGPGGAGMLRIGSLSADGLPGRNALGAVGGAAGVNATGYGAGGGSVRSSDTGQAGTDGFCAIGVI